MLITPSELFNSKKEKEEYRSPSFYLDAQSGDDNNDGLNWTNPFKSISKCLTLLNKGGAIKFYGKLREQGLVTPQGITDITIVGSATKVRGGHTVYNGPKGGATNWARSDRHEKAELLKVTQQGWKFEKLQLQGPIEGNSISLIRNIKAESDDPTGFSSGYAEFEDCVFVGPNQYGIYQEGGVNHVKINNCQFYNFYGEDVINCAIGGNNASVGYPVMWEITNNYFVGNLVNIRVGLCDSLISRNVFKFKSFLNGNTSWPLPVINLSGGGCNVVTGNIIGCNFSDFDKYFVKGQDDIWINNLYNDGIH